MVLVRKKPNWSRLCSDYHFLTFAILPCFFWSCLHFGKSEKHVLWRDWLEKIKLKQTGRNCFLRNLHGILTSIHFPVLLIIIIFILIIFFLNICLIFGKQVNKKWDSSHCNMLCTLLSNLFVSALRKLSKFGSSPAGQELKGKTLETDLWQSAAGPQLRLSVYLGKCWKSRGSWTIISSNFCSRTS